MYADNPVSLVKGVYSSDKAVITSSQKPRVSKRPCYGVYICSHQFLNIINNNKKKYSLLKMTRKHVSTNMIC